MKWVTLIAAISIHLCECLFYLYLFSALVLPFCVTIMSKIKSNNRNPRSASGPATGHYTQVIIVLGPFLWCCWVQNWKALRLRFKLSNYDNSLQVVWAETDKLGCANVYFNVRQNSFFLVTFQSKYSWCSKLYSKNVETTTFAQEASQPSFPYTNLVVCNYAVAGNLISGSMYSQVVKLTFSITLLKWQQTTVHNPPYQGPACSSCPSSTTCVDSLCQAAWIVLFVDYFCFLRGN